MALISCAECGKQVSEKARSCPNCGAPISVKTADNIKTVVLAVSKSRSLAVLLALILGGIGAHKFYLNRPGMGVLYLLFCWTFVPSIIGFFEGLNYLFIGEDGFQEKYGSKNS